MDVALGMVLGMVVAVSLGAGWRLVFMRGRVLAPEAAAMQAAVHAATSLLPPLRQGLTPETAKPAVRALRVLTGAQAVALAAEGSVLAFDGEGGDHHRAGDALDTLTARSDRVHVERHHHAECPLRSA